MDQQSCGTSISLLPLLMNGSLEAGELVLLRRHLAECSDCRLEVEATADWWELMDSHVPSRDMAAIGVGLPPSIWSEEEIGDHLELCSACLDELTMLRAAGATEASPGDAAVVRPLRNSMRARSPHFRSLSSIASMAAVVLLSVMLGFWFGASQENLTRAGSEFPMTGSESGQTPLLLRDGFESGGLATWIVGEGASDYESAADAALDV